MGDETSLLNIANKITDSLSLTDRSTVQVVGLNMQDENESTFHHSVDIACQILGKLDAFVNCYTYEGKLINNTIYDMI